MEETETVLWEGNPSQWSNFPVFLVCGLLCFLVIPLFIAFWRWLETKCFIYRVTSERIVTRRGVFSKRTEEVELYRVKDATLIEPFWLRMVSLGHIDLTTSDRTTPYVRLRAIPNASALREQLRKSVERQRSLKGVRETDLGEIVR